MKPVIFHLDAEDELNKSISYYEAQSFGLGFEFFENVKNSIEKIKTISIQLVLY